MNAHQRRKLRRELERWDKKLADSGFKDIEEKYSYDPATGLRTGGKLRQGATAVLHKNNTYPLIREQKQEYYTQLTHAVNAEKWGKRVLHRRIMEFAALGYIPQEIKRLLKNFSVVPHRHTIRKIIRQYEHKWGIRKWTAKELGLTTLPTE